MVKGSECSPSTPNLNHAEVYSFCSVNCMKRTKINKRGREWPILKKHFCSLSLQPLDCESFFGVLTNFALFGV